MATLAVMAKKKSDSTKPTRPGKAINVRITDELSDALDRFIESQRIPPKITDVVEVALHEFLEREGFKPKN
ncbi:MAG: hypothetical protein JNK93_16330 [Planctomycetia bacterium]|nr:hypothetical protein [Planctomycetia bacterium]